MGVYSCISLYICKDKDLQVYSNIYICREIGNSGEKPYKRRDKGTTVVNKDVHVHRCNNREHTGRYHMHEMVA